MADDNLLPLQEKSHSEIMRRCNFKNDHLIDPRLSFKNSLCSDVHGTPVEASNVVTEPDNKSDQDNVRCKKYSSMIKLITGSLVGDDKYSMIYTDLDNNLNESTHLGLIEIGRAWDTWDS